MQSDISRELLNKVPKKRQVALQTSYAKAPGFITKILNDNISKLEYIRNTYPYIRDKYGNYYLDERGNRIPEGCHYNEEKRVIVMNDKMTNDEYVDVMHHELGHFIDHSLGWPSLQNDFINVFDKTAKTVDMNSPEGRSRMSDILDDAFSTGAAYDRNICDILSALTKNHPSVVQRFRDENVAFYKHDNKYWNAISYSGESLGKRQKEAFANIFAIETDNYRISQNFVERWFPELVETFIDIVQG